MRGVLLLAVEPVRKGRSNGDPQLGTAPHGVWMFAVAISPDSKFVASLSARLTPEAKLKLWDAATEDLLAEHPTIQAQDGHLVFSPGSNILAVEDNGTGTDHGTGSL